MTSTGIHEIGPKAEALIHDSQDQQLKQLRESVISDQQLDSAEAVLAAIKTTNGELCARVERGLSVEFLTWKYDQEYTVLVYGTHVENEGSVASGGLIATGLAPDSHYRLSIVHRDMTPFMEGSQ